jgi:LysR family glycine cleavage system transcriptional activator
MLGTPRLPSLVAIRAFEAAARLGSFAKAAQELDTTSVSVSYHVRRLEQQTGLRLFVRHAQRVELTASGKLVAQETIKAFEALRASFVLAAKADEAWLSLTTLPTLGTSWLTPKLGRFRSKHPDIELDIDLSPEAQDLGTGRFDVAIRNGHGRWPGLCAIELFPSIFMPLCAPGLKAASAGIADPNCPLQVPLLGRSDWWRLWYHALGFNHVELAGRFGTHLSAEYLDIAAAVAGQGIAIGSPILFHDEIKAGRLVPAHDVVASDGRSFWFVFPVARHDSGKIGRFRDWVCAEAERDRIAAHRYIRGAMRVEPTA